MIKRLKLARARAAESGWMPGAIRKEIKKFRTPMRSVRGVCYHVAVSEGSSLYGYFSGARVCSHFYVRRDGTIEQYVSINYQAPANYQGNSSLVSVETQGGVEDADREPWTAAQVEANARIAAWVHKQKRVPLSLMPNSRKTSKGLCYHRQGVDPWRADGGEKWSSSYGKICPGKGKINQMLLVSQKAGILAGNPTLPDTGKPTEPPKEWDEMATKAEVQAAARAGALEALAIASQGNGLTVFHDRLQAEAEQAVRRQLILLVDEAANRSSETGRAVSNDFWQIIRGALATVDAREASREVKENV